ncbi:MAG: hypothetical protein KBB88_01840 [Candidatus Pacebacteria bacterium]|nr:hypothetical protein [Candidatus Paceibacterota bacterium]
MYTEKIKKMREVAKRYTQHVVFHEGNRLEQTYGGCSFNIDEKTEVSFDCWGDDYHLCVIDKEKDINVRIDFYEEGDFYVWVHFWKTKRKKFFRKEKRIITKTLWFYSGHPNDEEFVPNISDEHEWISFVIERMSILL